MHLNVTVKNKGWPHFSWATLYKVTVQKINGHLISRVMRFMHSTNCNFQVPQ